MSLDRISLYRLIWTTPGVQLAPMFGISGPGLVKLCRRKNVPLPGRGYWRQIQTGKGAKRALLPDPTENPQVWSTLTPELVERLAATPTFAELQAGVDGEGALRPAKSPKAIAARPIQPVLDSLPEKSLPHGVGLADAPPNVRLNHQQHQQLELTAKTENNAEAASRLAPTVEIYPSMVNLIELATRHEAVTRVVHFLDDVELEVPKLAPSVAALLRLWLHAARKNLRSEYPVHLIVAECGRVACGTKHPLW